MNRRLVATVGVGVTAFLLVAAAVTELLAARIAFSALVGLPVGLLVGVAAAVATRLYLWNVPAARPALLGAATVGYAVIVVAAASYSVPPVRGFVSVERALGGSVLVGVAVFALARRYPGRIDRHEAS